MLPITIIASPDVTLTTWDTSSASALFALTDANREFLVPWLPWVPNVKIVQDSVKFIQSSYGSWEKKTGLEFGIWYKSELAGCIGLHDLHVDQKRTSIGYWLGSDFYGNGIMTTAVQALTSYCFSELNLECVEISAAPENRKSRAIPERLGFKFVGMIREPEMINGEYQETVGYRMLKQDWLHSQD